MAVRGLAIHSDDSVACERGGTRPDRPGTSVTSGLAAHLRHVVHRYRNNRLRPTEGAACVNTPLLLTASCSARFPPSAQPPLELPQPSPAASVSQRIGLTDITITYHRPAVNKRPVWGQLVPYGQVWRAGANENTVITFSTPVSVGGQRLPAGSYGLHMIPTEHDWTIILSKEARAWGSFFYDEKDDAVRLNASPRTAEFEERLSYSLDATSDAAAVATLRWAALAVPFEIGVDTPQVSPRASANSCMACRVSRGNRTHKPPHGARAMTWRWTMHWRGRTRR